MDHAQSVGRLSPVVAHRVVTRLRLVAAVGIFVLVAGCGSGGGTDAGSGTPTAGTSEDYQLLIDFYGAESGSDVDPMVFVPAPGASAGVGPLSVRHVAGITPAPRGTSRSAALIGADGSPPGTTFGPWQQARGSVTFRCVGSKEQATSRLSGLIPSGTYSTFAVHTSVDGPRRFTPWGDAAGTTNNFTASKDGTASRTDSLKGCTGEADNIIVAWHSDGMTHGRSPGTIGVNWHTSLIAGVP